jgi:heme-degrading monooxygenase HmoA
VEVFAMLVQWRAMATWTVDVWTVRPGREAHFLEHASGLSPKQLTLYRDIEKPGAVFWSPARWESLNELNGWQDSAAYASVVAALDDDVLEHVTHVMEDVPGYPPTAGSVGERT